MFNAYLNFLGKVTRSNKELADREREARLENNEVVFSVEAFGNFNFLLDLVRGPHHANFEFIANISNVVVKRTPKKGKMKICGGENENRDNNKSYFSFSKYFLNKILLLI